MAKRAKFASFPANGVHDLLAEQAHKIARLAGAFSDADNGIPMAEFERTVIPEQTSSRLMLTCLLVAWMGLCMKLARSIREVIVDLHGGPLPRINWFPAMRSRTKQLL